MVKIAVVGASVPVMLIVGMLKEAHQSVHTNSTMTKARPDHPNHSLG